MHMLQEGSMIMTLYSVGCFRHQVSSTFIINRWENLSNYNISFVCESTIRHHQQQNLSSDMPPPRPSFLANLKLKAKSE